MVSKRQGHILLAGKPYMVEMSRYQKSLANPFAARMATGAGDYRDLSDWAAWLMEDWQAGAGQDDATSGGYLYGTLDARFQGRLFLHPLLSLTKTTGEGLLNRGSSPESVLVGSGGIQRLAFQWTAPANETLYHVWIWARKTSNPITVEIWSDNGGAPGAKLAGVSWTWTVDPLVGDGWIHAMFDQAAGVAVSANTSYWCVVYPTDPTHSITLIGLPNAGSKAMKWNGTAWETYTSAYGSTSFNPFHVIGVGLLDSLSDIVRFGSDIYAAAGPRLYRWDSSNSVWSLVWTETGSNDILDLEVFDNTLWLAVGSAGHWTRSSAGTMTQYATDPATLWTTWRGYIYRAHGSNLWYTNAAGGVWSGPTQIGDTTYPIRGLAGMGDVDVYVGKDDGLYVFTTGDQVQGVTPFPSAWKHNASAMHNHQGDIYLSVGTGVHRFTGSGQFLSMGLEVNEGLPAGRAGRTAVLGSLTYWVLAGLAPEEIPPAAWGKDYGAGSIWAFTSVGWNSLAVLPDGCLPCCLYYDRETSTLWVGMWPGLVGRIALPVRTENPLQEAGLSYEPVGWVETPWFSGGLKEVQKDLQDIYIAGDRISTDNPVEVYYMLDDDADWRLLGRIQANRSILEFPSGSRTSRELRLGILLRSRRLSDTPVIRAIRLRYMPMVWDRWQWRIPVRIGYNIEMLDGNLDSRTVEQQIQDLDTAIRSLEPIELEDVDGITYQVKVTQAAQAVWGLEIVGDTVRYEAVVNLALLQVV